MLAAGVAAAVYLAFGPDRPDPRFDDEEVVFEDLVPMPIAELGVIEIVRRSQTFRYQRDADGAWFSHRHDQAAADAGPETTHQHVADPDQAARIEQVFAMFGRARIERRLPPDSDKAEFGLVKPEMMVLLYARESVRPDRLIMVGNIAPDTLSRFILVHGDPAIAIIPDYHITNLTDLIEGRPRRKL